MADEAMAKQGLSLAGLLWAASVCAIATALSAWAWAWNVSFVAATAELSDRTEPWDRACSG